MKRALFLDIEVYKNYFLAQFMSEDHKVKRFEIFNGDTSEFDAAALLKLLKHKDVEIFTFNGNSYDIPLLVLAMTNPNTAKLKQASNEIIEGGMRPWNFYRKHSLREPEFNHVDLIEVAPGMVGLKLYMGRMGTRKLQELPIEHTAEITPDQVPLLRKYCKNDTIGTMELRDNLSEQLELRRSMGKEYGLNLMSKSDAQIAEAVLKSEYERITGEVPSKVKIANSVFKYNPPDYVKFNGEELKEVLRVVTSADMIIDSETGHVKMPKEISNLKICIGTSTYKIGIGGLHSQESEAAHHTDENNVLIDRDVASYYPTMMLNMNMEPGGFGKHFNPIFRSILDERLVAKRAGEKVKSDSLKIVLNGTFGKTASKYSTIYSPEFMIRTTITGQLTILMLIEALERRGIPVVSANTDGIVIKCPRDKVDTLNKVVSVWEQHTGLETEETLYKSLYSRDVNNYIAVKMDGSAKSKGVYGRPTLSKNPQNTICSEAVIEYLTQGIPVEDTIRTCDDIRKFISLRTVTGGAVKGDRFIGKAIRWYYAKGVDGCIHYAKNGNTVPRSEGARDIMDLPETTPDDIDYGWYIKECEEMLMALGAVERPFVEKIPRKNSNAWKELRDTGQIIENDKGKWEWTE